MPKIYLSPSFQQQNMGVGDYGTEEYRCNQIADVVERELKKDTKFVVVRNNPNMSLEQVIADSNKSGADIHFSIHTNAGESSARGCEVFAYVPNTEADKLAHFVYNRLAAITPSEDRGIKYNSLAETRQTKAIAVLIEVAFHSNEEDAKWIINNVEQIGKELAQALYDYYGEEKIENPVVKPGNPAVEFEKYDKKIGEYQSLLNTIYQTGLVVDNWWGKKTAAATRNHVALQYGSSGKLVRWYQARLKEQGYELGNTGDAGVDGDFKEKTKIATEEFQRKYNLDLDGIAGIQVITKLVELL